MIRGNPLDGRAAARASAATDGLAARRTAAKILFQVETRRAYADVLLGHHLEAFSTPDRRLITRLVLGSLAWRGRLDHELAHLSSRPLDELDPAVMAILRLGLFQLRFMSRIPAHAAVNTAVQIAREGKRTGSAGGLINAILRRATASAEPLPRREKDAIGYLAVAGSHPRWLVEKFVNWFGIGDAERLMAANNAAAPNVLRLNLALGTRADVLVRLGEIGVAIADGGALPETAFSIAPANLRDERIAGLVYAQSEASQWVSRMLAPTPGATAIDCAAAPGGKATHIAQLTGPSGRVIALDRNFAGLERARSAARRLRLNNLIFVCADLTGSAPLTEYAYDFVLLDAPCTGLGTLREHPEIRWRLQPDDPARMAAIQFRMLENAAALVRAGGAIVYAVCSLAPEEGSGVVHRFLAHHPDFTIDREPPVPPALRSELNADATLLARPDRDGRDGFFAARLIRRRK
ncbi:MAG: 16S rRNA (cytosine(967)-C(5))-methyltransferase RsmB [Candidatus Binataceae bacterium]